MLDPSTPGSNRALITFLELAVLTSAAAVAAAWDTWIAAASSKRTPDHQVAAAHQRLTIAVADLASDQRALQAARDGDDA